MYDYEKLKNRIIIIYATQKNFSNTINMSESRISLRLNNLASWKQDEIIETIKALKLKEKNIPLYFFNKKVEKTQ